MENPVILWGLTNILERNQGRIGIRMDEEDERKACDISSIMFLDIEYKGIMKKVLIIQREIGETELKKIEDKLRRTEVNNKGIRFDYVSLLEKDYLKEIRKRVMRGYLNGWHTYLMYLGEEPKIGIKVIIKGNEKDQIIKDEKIKLIRIKDIKKEENQVIKKEKEHELDVISDMKRVELKPKKERKEWYNKYSKRFLQDLFRVEKITKRVIIDERLDYNEKEEMESESDMETTEETESISEEV